MKKSLIVFILVAALLAVLAAPALAVGSDANWRPALQTAYVFTYNGGSWFESTNVADPNAFVIHWAATDEDDNWIVGSAAHIPANYDVVMQLSWKEIGYWAVAAFSDAVLIDLSIPDAGVQLSKRQCMAFWTGPILWDKYWEVATGLVLVPYDPRLKLKTYANRFLVPLTGTKGIATNLTADKKLRPGTYTVYYTETWVLPVLVLSLQDPPQD
ncbi:MAG: hypothetical protein NTW58_03555, partial [Actinobacteria bacterium]|nr:hypothetical protein [Actinomycetota bacterium]